jgi:ABC-type Fe3+/spermidine/putrescine transport system ATPase subunit
MSDRLAVMNAGAIEQVGAPAEIYYSPATRFVAGFIGKSNLLGCEIERDRDGSVARCGGLDIRVAGEHEPGEATAVVRYEAVEVSSSRNGRGPRANSFSAVIEDIVFLGDGQELVMSAQGQQLTARCPAGRAARYDRGDTVEVSFEPDDVVVIRG